MKTVLVTGGSRGLGRAIADNFAAQGWRVIATVRGESSTGDNGVLFKTLDLSSEESVHALTSELARDETTIDLLVNNAGTNPKDNPDRDYFMSTFKIAHFSPDAVDDSLRVNALMPFKLISALLPQLSEDAAIVNISSWLGSIGGKTNPGHYGYAGSKALLNMFTKSLAIEWGEDKRSCVALNPGWMQTDMGGQNAKTTPLEVAQAIQTLYEGGVLHAQNGAFLNTDGSHHAW